TPKYHVIVGCFGNQKNSSRLIKKLNKKGYKAYKLDVHKNLHRVALATYDLKEDAILAQLEIKKVEKMSSWVLTK
ncbi:MAG: SPOR domain-containing protein, partial [Bacteroidota bacterium]|nr:SPOR domain-containing protein [Bacteroidota bacterium]